MSTIKSSTTSTTAYQVVADTTGTLVFQTGATPTTAMTLGSDQSVTFAGAVSLSGNQTTTGNLTVNGNTTLGDASTDTVLMTGAPSIGGAGLGMGMGFRNRIINGAMMIAQRGTGAITVDTSDQFPVDRMKVNGSTSGKLTSQQNQNSVTPPVGFTNYLGVTSSSAYSIPSGEAYSINHIIEGYNFSDLGWGAVGAQPVTISFWVRSSLTGVFGAVFRNSSGARSYPFTFTINSANTWEYKSVTISGDVTGTWVTTNGAGLILVISMGCGSTYLGTPGTWGSTTYFGATGQTNLVGTNGATFYITGVQLEKGSTATSFDYRPYGTELQLCQRYCNVFTNSDSTNQRHSTFAMASSTTQVDSAFSFKTSMRTAPSVSVDTIANIKVSDGATAFTASAYSIMGAVNGSQQALVAFTSSGLTAFRPYFVESNGTLNSAKIIFSSEL